MLAIEEEGVVPCQTEHAINWILKAFLLVDEEELKFVDASIDSHADLINPFCATHRSFTVGTLGVVDADLTGCSAVFNIVSLSLAVGASVAFQDEPVGGIVVDDVQSLLPRAHVDSSCPHSSINSVQLLGGTRVLSEPVASLAALSGLASQECILFELELSHLPAKHLLVQAFYSLRFDRSLSVDHGAVFVVRRRDLAHRSRERFWFLHSDRSCLLLWCEQLGNRCRGLQVGLLMHDACGERVADFVEHEVVFLVLLQIKLITI